MPWGEKKPTRRDKEKRAKNRIQHSPLSLDCRQWRSPKVWSARQRRRAHALDKKQRSEQTVCLISSISLGFARLSACRIWQFFHLQPRARLRQSKVCGALPKHTRHTAPCFFHLHSRAPPASLGAVTRRCQSAAAQCLPGHSRPCFSACIFRGNLWRTLSRRRGVDTRPSVAGVKTRKCDFDADQGIT